VSARLSALPGRVQGVRGHDPQPAV
jgi:hypothetical protein